MSSIEELRIEHSPLSNPKDAVDCTYQLADNNRLMKINKKRTSRYRDKGEFKDTRFWVPYKGNKRTIHNISRCVIQSGKHYEWR